MASATRRGRLLDVRPGEWPRTIALFGHLFVVIATLIILKSVSSALFLKRLDPASLPYLYIGSAVVVSAVVALSTRFIDRVPRRVLILVTTLVFVASIGLFWIWLRRHSGNWVYPALYLWVEVYGTVMTIQFWTFAGDLLTGMQGRRLFGFVGAGGVVGSILGGALVSATADPLGSENMLLLAGALLLGIPPFLVLAARGGLPPARTLSRDPNEPTGRAAADYLRANRYPWVLAGIAFATAVGTTLIDYQFKIFAAEAAHTDASLTKFFGQYNLVGGVVSLLLQLFVTGVVLNRVGILAAVAFTPLVLTAGTGLVLFWPTLTAVFVLKLLDSALGHSIDLSGKQLLYVPLPERLAGTIQTFIEGVVGRVGLGFTGAILPPLAFLLSKIELSWVTLGFLVLWLAFALSIRQSYRAALHKALTEEGFRPRSDLRAQLDVTTLRELIGVLKSGDEERVLLALDFLDQTDVDIAPYLQQLLEMPSPEVHRRALQNVVAKEDRDAIEVIAGMLGRLPADITAEAVEAIGRLAPEQAAGLIRRFLAHADPSVRGAAIRAVLADGRWDADDVAALERFEEMLGESVGDCETCRVEAARALADPHLRAYRYYLLHYLRDGSEQVQRSAIRAAAETRDPAYLPILVERTLPRATRETAIRALAGYGEPLLPELDGHYAAAAGWKRLRTSLVRVAGAIGSDEAAGFLLGRVKFGNSWERYDLIKELNRIRARRPDARLDPQLVQDAIFREAEDYYRNAHYLVQLGYPERDHLLMDALLGRLALATERVSRLLALVYPPEVIFTIYRGAAGRNVRIASNAQELLDSLIDRPTIKRLILPLFGDAPVERTVAAGGEQFAFVSRSVEAVLREIVEHSPGWPRLCALYFAGDPGVPELRPLLEWVAREDGDRDAREAAQLALRRLQGERSEGGFVDTLVEKVLFLKSVDLFSGLSGEHLTELASALKQARFAAGEMLFDEGDPGDSLYIIASGRVQLLYGGEPMTTVDRGAPIGELGAVDGGPRMMKGVAATDVEAYVLSERDLAEILQDNAEIARSLLRSLASRVRVYLHRDLRAQATANAAGGAAR
jgi:ATP/ADP translocase/HEAT repeat protein